MRGWNWVHRVGAGGGGLTLVHMVWAGCSRFRLGNICHRVYGVVAEFAGLCLVVWVYRCMRWVCGVKDGEIG